MINYKKGYIIAEVAQGYEGRVDYSKLFVKAASKSNANAVKFQVIFSDEQCTNDYIYHKLFKSLEMKKKDWKIIKKSCDKYNIDLILDVYGEKSIEIANHLNINTIMIHASDISNEILLKKISKNKFENIILGIGGATLNEIETAINLLGKKNIILMFGFQSLPTDPKDLRINRLKFLNDWAKNKKNIICGYSDHSDPKNNWGNNLSIISIGFGIKIFERHLTLSNCLKLEDNESALNPDTFLNFSEIIKNSIKINKKFNYNYLSSKELIYKKNMRRTVTAKRNLKKGEILNDKNICLLRTGQKGSFYLISELIGKQLKKDVPKDSPINKNCLKK